jgi:hypothetical protein
VGWSQPVPFQIQVKPDSITVGDRVSVIVSYQADSNLIVVPESWEKQLPDFVEFFSKDLSISKSQPNEKIITYSIALFDTGKLALPPFVFHVRKSDSDTTSFQIGSDSIYIHVHSIVLATGDTTFAPPNMPVGVPFPWKKYGLPFFLILFVLTIVYWLYKKWKKKQQVTEAEIVPEEPAMPIFDITMEKLKQLAKKEPTDSVDRKFVFSELSFILREYLEKEYHFPALESTTREIRSALKEKIEEPDLVWECLKVLETCDMVKFAKYESSNDELKTMIQKGIDFVIKSHNRLIQEKSEVIQTVPKTGEDEP